MKVHLLYPGRDLDLEAAPGPEADDLVQDLALEPLFGAMARGDALVLQVARSVLLAHRSASVDVVRYRQAALADCLERRDDVRALYDCAGDGLQKVRDLGLLRLYARSPGSTLYSALHVIGPVMATLGRLRELIRGAREHFRSDAFRNLFDTALADLDDAFFEAVQAQRQELEFPKGVLLSQRLGDANKGVEATLRRPRQHRRRLLEGLLGEAERGLSFSIHPRDESGHNALRELRDSALNEAANALAQANDHVLAFFTALRAELAYYLGCLNLHDTLSARGAAVCMPGALAPETRSLRFAGLRDASLVVLQETPVVPNGLDATGRHITVVTGANRGGKTTFLRSLGQAYLMMGAGMFVAAEAFGDGLCDGLYTHFKREEDPSMTGGKLDEELARLGKIVARLGANSVLAMNESFGATNEAEGSELARQVLQALSERRVRVVFVTHFYEFARAWHEAGRTDTVFLRAERLADERRTYRVLPGDPLETSFAADVYRRVFGSAPRDEGGSAADD
jgi:hypothetical protein